MINPKFSAIVYRVRSEVQAPRNVKDPGSDFLPRQPSRFGYVKKVKLRQGQVWKRGEEYIRIVRLERIEVEYKSMPTLIGKEGTHHHLGKKEFCRLLKGAVLLAPLGINAG